jgi:hypothetical protein
MEPSPRLNSLGKPARATRSASRALVFVAALFAFLLWGRAGEAESESLPLGLQVQLLAKVAGYDRNLPERSGGRVRVAVFTKRGNADSERAAAQLLAVLKQTATIGGFPHEDQIVEFVSAESLAASCRSDHLSIVYFTPGFQDDLKAVRAALQGVSVLSVGTVPSYVAAGVVLGFDTVSAKPKLLFHVTQAKAQSVAMSTEVVRLMTVFE